MSHRTLSFAAVAFLNACASPLPPVAPESYLNAVITGAFTADHRGAAHFGSGTLSATRVKFEITSGDGDTSFHLERIDSFYVEPEPGVYEVDRSSNLGGPPRFTATIRHGGAVYDADSGTLTITLVAHHERIQGTFEISAVYRCPSPVGSSGGPYTLPEECRVPGHITVRGEFSATPSPPVPVF